ncbi:MULTISPECIES: efflux RND transporter periplasmic adaptor subunit [unclassified Undibacterium]|uniref:efflux RND transporter periplasmic adaptor subunit n=1 Tax=unclassified Undibacterium TaxID=2630295 RepID=UPI002AC94B3A|nr:MULTISPECIES: efflux RND transporter periplasmic adaptor subunit [unclassified Undibacterium]MEB0140830.1 efflux RND transporter periplasmic adaptor subunit [Undibacterium sp. CCC2.1]MEB0173777.1 efflux RND transporter periplasmic adaptor subunit [Undibacterium sp. CCC1.1]MEB0177783.1 efflux RND transporter periplasmic adaptor subunit [Undibacterium sp. CCC3.4]MEB0216983.1 efflux RND transporter periplasmic adaptor subunit [Undibacterium sp. 5I2]WPX45422.1 efflux RND transporter periplasmic
MRSLKIAVPIIVVSIISFVAYRYYFVPSAPAVKSAVATPVAVSTVLAKQTDYTVRLTASGVVTPVTTVDIRPQVSSTVAAVHIKEGQFVTAGTLLFTLDSRADEVNLAKAQAQLEKDQASLRDYQRQAARSVDLLGKKFLSQSAVDTTQTLVDTQQAVLAADRAAVNAARVALSYNRIVAPSAGRTGSITVYPGSLVQAGSTAPALVTITRMDQMAISFPLPQANLPDALESMRRSDSFVLASLPGRSDSFRGRLEFVDNTVDAATGTIRLKAVFDNTALALWPGAYANLEMSVQTIKDAVLIPQAAIIVGARESAVYVLGAGGKVDLKTVQVTHSYGADALVKGLPAGSAVITDGKQNLRPGMLVLANPAKTAAL